MLKKIFVFFSLFFLNISFVQAKIDPYCNDKILANLIKTVDNSQPKIIEVIQLHYICNMKVPSPPETLVMPHPATMTSYRL